MVLASFLGGIRLFLGLSEYSLVQIQLLLNLVCVQCGTRNQRRHDRDLLGLHNVGIGRIGFRDGGIRVRNVLILVGYRLCRDVYLCYIRHIGF